jgi:hypothetical protein
MYGGMTMLQQVEQVLTNSYLPLMDILGTEWYGAFTRNGILIAITGVTRDN